MGIDYLTRYEYGDFRAWDELVDLAPEVLKSPEFLEQARAVAQAIMTRVDTNVTTVRRSLLAAGAALEAKGTPLTSNDLKPFTEKFGTLPLSLDVFYRLVGSISLTPKSDYFYGEVTLQEADGVSLIALDPLQVYPANELSFQIDEFEQGHEQDSFQLVLCPDFLHKQDISGGMPYSVQLPPATPRDALDPIVLWERHNLSFVNYLRYCFRWGGFSGLDVCDEVDNAIDINWRIGYENVEGPWRPAYIRLLSELRKNLVEF